jgi:hypothetical protein
MGLSGWWVARKWRRDRRRADGGPHGSLGAKIALMLLITAVIVVLVLVFASAL